MMGLDLGITLMLWILVSAALHEYGHTFMAKICGRRTIGFFAQPIPGVILERPKKLRHGILMLTGGWIFGMLSILFFLPFVDANYVTIFSTTSFIVHTVLSMTSDGIGIIASLKFGVLETWSYYSKGILKRHRKLEKIGLSKIMITNRKLYEKLIEETKIFPEYCIGFIDTKGIKKCALLISLLGLVSTLLIALVNWPLFWLLSFFGIKILVDFSNLFLAALGITFIFTALERITIFEDGKEQNS